MGWQKYLVLTVALLAVQGGLMQLVFFEAFFQAGFQWAMTLRPGSIGFGIWEELPVPLTMRLYFFNVTNAAEVAEFGSQVKIELDEVGPYVFEQRSIKKNVEFDEQIGTVTYEDVKYYEHIPDKSVGNWEEDVIFFPNIIAAAVVSFVNTLPEADQPFMIMTFSQLFIDQQIPLFLSQTVKEVAFDGFKERILELVEEGEIPPDGIDMDINIPFDKFGWFYGRNGTVGFDGKFEMYSGQRGFDALFGSIVSYNDQQHLDIFEDECGVVKGSAGEFFPPNLPQTSLDYFSPDLCRSINFDFVGEQQVEGVDTNRYELMPDLLNNTAPLNESYYWPNHCYQAKNLEKAEFFNGLLDVSQCKFGAPAYVSYPHFLHADPRITLPFANDTFKPSEELHTSYMMMEPSTSIPADVKIRLQINALFQPVCRETLCIELFNKLEPVYVPMIWFESGADLEASGALVGLWFVQTLPFVARAFAGLVVAAAVLVVVAIATSRTRQRGSWGTWDKIEPK